MNTLELFAGKIKLLGELSSDHHSRHETRSISDPAESFYRVEIRRDHSGFLVATLNDSIILCGSNDFQCISTMDLCNSLVDMGLLNNIKDAKLLNDLFIETTVYIDSIINQKKIKIEDFCKCFEVEEIEVKG